MYIRMGQMNKLRKSVTQQKNVTQQKKCDATIAMDSFSEKKLEAVSFAPNTLIVPP
jgi:hypothetical protein